ncbi:MAG: benzoate/H(+) symporter BenE family transporter, partial [Acidimicrobiia bacterium]
NLTPGQITGWIVAVYGVAGVLGVTLSFRYRQPLLLTGNVFVLIYIARLGADVPWRELIGCSILAGAIVLGLGPLGLTKRLISLLPGPIVFGLLAGAVLGFVVEMFSGLGDEPLLIGGTLIVYVAARLFVEPRVPAILPALAAALLISWLSGDLAGLTLPSAVDLPRFSTPVFSLGSAVAVTPVLVVLITVQANVPSLVFLRQQGYQPPERVLGGVSGVGTMLGSILGPTGISLSLPATALSAGPDAGDRSVRHISAYVAGGAAVLVAVLAPLVVQVAADLPETLLTTGVGLAVLGILSDALKKASEGPLRWGPLFAFVIALSDLSLGGLGAFFWALVGGAGVSLLLERKEWKRLVAETGE